MAAHVCEACGMLHDAPVTSEPPEVAIARIQAESALAIEKLRARTDRHITETETETAETIAETEAEAEVAVAEATAEVIGEVLAAETGSDGEDETEPEPVVVAEIPEPELDVAPPPVDGPAETGPKKKPGWAFS